MSKIRNAAVGFFWQDLPLEPRIPKEKVLCVAPEPTWLNDIPEVDPSNFELTTLEGLLKQSHVALDLEIYPNYFLACLMGADDGKVFYLEATDSQPFDGPTLRHILNSCTTVTFNGNKFDIPIAEFAIAGRSVRFLKQISDDIILRDERIYARKRYDTIDTIEIAPLRASLKTYAGRLHTHKMQDLPFHPDTELTERQIEVVRHYCVNDLRNTLLLAHCLRQEIELRYTLSARYGVDVRSKSDAQIAETIIGRQMSSLLGRQIRPPGIEPGRVFHYTAPDFIQFKTPVLQDLHRKIEQTRFSIDFAGGVESELGSPSVTIGGRTYALGVGGLHSSEQSVTYRSNSEYQLIDKDVTSYYPFVILNLGMFPKQLGPQFSKLYQSIVDERIEAKQSGNKSKAESLKIVVNGTFGKLGSPHSILYAPELLIKVTITGQLSLLLLIEALELAGIAVISANTDGVTAYVGDRAKFDAIVKDWERSTGFETEETLYQSLHSRDVNNYLAMKPDGAFKSKGAYANPPLGSPEALHKNPVLLIAIEAVKAYLLNGTPLMQTITECKDIRQFVVVRNVKGGAVKEGAYFGKVVRWIYAQNVEGSFIYASSGRKVPKTEGARALMQLPDAFPNDLDYARYLHEAERMLADIGVAE